MTRTLALTFLLICTLLCIPTQAQFESSVGSNVIRRPCDLAPHEASPMDLYQAVQNDYPFTPAEVLGTIYTPRPARFVGVVVVDHAYWVQNRYAELVSSYQEYTANIIRAVPRDPWKPVTSTQVCTQFCGQMIHPGFGTYALAPFQGDYVGPPQAPFPVNCQGVEPWSDTHFFRAVVTVPVEFLIEAGETDIHAHVIGGMGVWNEQGGSSATHLYAYQPCINTIALHGWILSR